MAGLAMGVAGTMLLGRAPFGHRRPGASMPDLLGVEGGRGGASTPPSTRALEAGFEVADADAGALWRVMGIFALSTIASVALMIFVLGRFHRDDAALEARLTAVEQTRIVPPAPNLQADPQGDLGRLRAREYGRLHQYAKLASGHARIPIERAMALLAGTKLDPPGSHMVDEGQAR